MPVDRRELFRIVSAGIAGTGLAGAQHQHPTPSVPTGPYEPRALSGSQYATLQRLLEILLPADEHSPSARDAGVGRYIDTTLKYGEEGLRNGWTAGLDAVDALARDRTGKGFVDADSGQAVELVRSLAAKETAPKTVAERYFVTLKRAAIDAYYLSDGGRKSLGYTGDTAITEFRGCTHSEHNSNT